MEKVSPLADERKDQRGFKWQSIEPKLIPILLIRVEP